MPPDTRAVIDTSAWPRPPVFDWIQGQGAIAWREIHRTFNCGIGLVAVVAEPDAARTIGSLSPANYKELTATMGVIGERSAFPHGRLMFGVGVRRENRQGVKE